MKKVVVKKAKTITLFRPSIFSRHPSHDVLRPATKNIKLLPFRSVIRFGSVTEVGDSIAKGGRRIEINTIQSIKNSANKLLMKRKFINAGVKTAPWFTYDTGDNLFIPNGVGEGVAITALEFPIVAKHHFGSKGRGNTLIKTQADLEAWMRNKDTSNYIFEKFMNYGHEFRLHVTEEGCFYACRKALKADVPEDQKWRRHDDICVWFLDTNEAFHRPNSWDVIVTDCVNALKAIGADILSFDVRVQSPTDGNGRRRPMQDYILLECNSASSMDNGTGELSVCAKKYIEEIPKIIIRKGNQ